MSEEENWDITNEREFMKGVLTALSKVLDITEKERNIDIKALKEKLTEIYQKAMYTYLDIAEGEWSEVLSLMLR